MQRKQFLQIAAGIPATFLALPGDRAVPVKLQQISGGKWQLLRGGTPYFVRGAGGTQNLEILKASGGNSIRTWGADKAEQDLENARRLGLTVTVGLWLGHKAHGFKYDDPKMVADQLATVRGYVEKYRNHPALLSWGVGNEMEGDGKDPLVWKAVEEIARMIKQTDPNHPTMTVVAELGENGIKPRQVAALCPNIDILGVNSYGGLPSLPKRLKEAGWTKPYIVTEFGPPGPWEVMKTDWGASLEPNSTEKAAIYAKNYAASVATQEGWCVGSYAFLWSNKFEGTATWFGMFLPGTNDKLGPVDAMAQAWSGKPSAKQVPQIFAFESDAASKKVAPGSQQRVTCRASGSGGTTLTYRFEIRPDTLGPLSFEPGQKPLPAVAGVVPAESASGEQTFTTPTKEGAYRLFVYIRDGAGGAATANLPFFVTA